MLHLKIASIIVSMFFSLLAYNSTQLSKNMFTRFFSKNIEIKPDKPVGFGYKNQWYAIHTTDQEAVARALNLKRVRKSNWRKGIQYGYTKGKFIAPEIDGWILVLGFDTQSSETEFIRDQLIRLSKEFGECQIFQTHRVVEAHLWGKAINGKIERLYGFIGESGENIVVEGDPTLIEKKYNLVNTFSEEAKKEGYWDREDIYYPNEETVMEIAEAWSINPTKIEEFNNINGLGLIGKSSRKKR